VGVARSLDGLRSDPVWTERCERVAALIERVAGDGLLGTYHVGSTAVADLAGEPALDVIAVYDDETALSAAATALADAEGYELAHEDETDAVVARWVETDDGTEAEFLKLHRPGDETVHDQLVFRAYVAEHPDACRRYERVKREAAERHPGGGSEYTAYKREVVAEILDDARDRGYFADLPAAVRA
jgi:dephospho-CoA kinase